MSYRNLLLEPLLLRLVAAGCKRDDDPDLTDPVPVILDVTVNTETVVEYQDSIVFIVEYRDGDGDLGENEPNVANLFLVDNRIDVTEDFRIRELAPEGAVIPVTGTLRVVLRSTGITDNSSSQTVNYTIFVRDRAGNESNRFTTPDITVTR
mgnify:CR=1 FL=1